MKRLIVLTLLAIGCVANAQQQDVVIQNFEGADYGAWKTEGAAFGGAPAHGNLENQQSVSGFSGNGLANSFNGGNYTTGKLISPDFTIERKYIRFGIGGGNRSSELYIALLIDGKMVRRATGTEGTHLEWKYWDVSEFAGKTAQIQIVDNAVFGMAYILVDDIIQSNSERGVNVCMEDTGGPVEREINITKRYLSIPVKRNAPARKMVFLLDGKPVHYSTALLSDNGETDFPAFIDVGDFLGKTITVMIDRLPGDSLALSKMTQYDAILDADTIYREKHRPKFHFTAQHGWLNDPNGLVFYKGEYHLFFQYNPTGLGGPGFNMHWGHAVSPDLVHWTELPIAIAPTVTEPGIWSGSAVVDWNNTSELKRGSEPPLIALYTCASNQYMAFSNDRGRSWTRYEKNPVLPSLIAGNRDPKVTWHEGTKRWVMALYLSKNDYALFTSQDLKHWTKLQTLTLPGCGECPDFFPLVGGGKPNMWAFVAANNRYLIGEFDGEKFNYEGNSKQVEFGANCYATQTYSDIPASDGRRIQIAWMPGTGYPGLPYSQQMSFPCELSLHETPEGPCLFKFPVAEISKLYRTTKRWENTPLAPGANLLNGITGDLFDISAEIEIGDANDVGFVIGGTPVHYDVASKQLFNTKAAPMQAENGRIKLRILVDCNSLEVYGNGGAVAITSRYVPDEKKPSLEIFSKNGTAKVVSMEVHELQSAWDSTTPQKAAK